MWQLFWLANVLHFDDNDECNASVDDEELYGFVEFPGYLLGVTSMW
jgi:hypothetical protein